jgi:hypothetical protein
MNSVSNLVKACGVLVSAWMVACSGAAQHHVAVAANGTASGCQGRAVHGDAELAAVAGCSQIQGDLSITGVSSLESLGGLKRVNGSLTIRDNPELTDLAGLESLARVDTMVLERNGFFTVEGLEGVREIGRLAIAENPRLISVAGLNQVRSVGELVIVGNPRLSAYYGLLPRLERNPARVIIEDNRGLAAQESAALSKPRVVAMTASVR